MKERSDARILGSRINPDTHGRAVELINARRLSLDKLFTHSYPVEQLPEAIIKQTENDSIKVLIESGI